jgi:hypothetical protein
VSALSTVTILASSSSSFANIRDDPNWISIWQRRVATKPTEPNIIVKRTTATRRKTTRTTTETTTAEPGAEPVPTRPVVQGAPLSKVEGCVYDRTTNEIVNVPGVLNDCYGACEGGKFLTVFIVSMTRMACCCK